MAKLIVIEGPLTGQSFELTDEMTIGRLPECAIALDDASVSRRHTRVQSRPDGVYVEDLNSSNGTFVNGQNIAGPSLLRDGDVVEVSKRVFRFAGGEESARAVPGKGDEGRAAAVGVSEDAGLGVEITDDGAAGASIEGTLDMGATMVGGFTPSAAGDQAKANERLRRIIQISDALQTELELKVLLGLVLDKLFDVFRLADRGFLMLYDEDGNLKPAAARNRAGEPMSPGALGLAWPGALPMHFGDIPTELARADATDASGPENTAEIIRPCWTIAGCGTASLFAAGTELPARSVPFGGKWAVSSRRLPQTCMRNGGIRSEPCPAATCVGIGGI